eukprot:scpid32522/ scgid29750/ Usher syndrome type-1G protein; Scaffold protein containing ankyrin repeats and SAM domain
MSLFHDAASTGDLAMLRRVGKRDLVRQDQLGMTPLHCAAKAGSLEAARMLITRGADANALDNEGQTCVHVAARHGHTALVRHLIEAAQANVWALNDGQLTAYDLAATHSHTQVFRYLDALQVRMMTEHRSSMEKAKTRALRDYNKRLAARSKLDEKSAGRRRKTSQLVASGSQEPLPERSRAFSEPINPPLQNDGMRTAAASHAEAKSKKSRWRKDSAPAAPQSSVTTAPDSFPTKLVSGIRDKFSLRPTQHHAHQLGERSKSETSVFLTSSAPVSTGRVNKMAQAVQRLQTLGGLGPGDEESLTRNLAALPVASDGFDSDAHSTRSEGRSKAAKRKPRSSGESFLPRGASDSELCTAPRGKNTAKHKQHQQPAAEKPVDRERATARHGPDDATRDAHSQVASFLHTLELDEFLALLEEEQVDMSALMLCSDLDLKDLDMPLGPRRKILAALRQRKGAMSSPPRLHDSYV